MKRALDVLLSLAALIVLSPVLLLAAAAIAIESGGPVFFKQVRLGLGGREFGLNASAILLHGLKSLLLCLFLRLEFLDELPLALEDFLDADHLVLQFLLALDGVVQALLADF